MAVTTYSWPARQEFRDRVTELGALETWWKSSEREPLSLYGRRRVGKSWLFRRFAHDKPAVILVADRVVIGQQLRHLADQLAPALGVTPQLDDVAALFTVLYDLAGSRKILVVIDEFPYLLGSTAAEQQRTLSSIQAVMEHKRDSSRLKLLLTGSTIAQMEQLQAEQNPLHGRLRPLALWPMPFAAATLLLGGEDPCEQLTRYSIAGGMPRYLDAIGAGELTTAISENVVSAHSQLFNEPRTILQTELREPRTYFSILAELAGNPQDVSDIAAALRVDPKELSGYLGTLESLRLVARRLPVGAGAQSRGSQWRCTDHFVRFWFRFVQPFQSELEAGADPVAHVESNITPLLADHTAPVFEEAVVDWLRREHRGSTAVGGWWGPALHHLRRTKERSTEEIDAVALSGTRVAAVAEATWTNRPTGVDVLTDLLAYKLPALAQAGFQVEDTRVVIAARSGFTTALHERAATDPRVRLVHAADLLGSLVDAGPSRRRAAEDRRP